MENVRVWGPPHKAGFTLIELLVVIGIIGILSSIVLTSLNQARAKARDARRFQEAKQIMNALELYYTDNGHYPYPIAEGSWIYSTQTSGDWPVQFKNDLAKYMPTVPKDPLNIGTASWNTSFRYAYYSNTDPASTYCPQGKCYFLVFQVEKGPNPYEKTDGVMRCNGLVYDTSDTSYPNYITWGMGCK